jgi:SMI1 / KNR4 family (SUKH-1)
MNERQIIKQVENEIGITLPSFYVAFLVNEKLITDRLFSNLTLLYGPENLKMQQERKEIQKYLPRYICIGDDSGDYGFFVKGNSNNNTNIYVTELGDLDEVSLEKIADSFEQWKEMNYDSEIFLENLFQNQTDSPLVKLRGTLHQLKKELYELQLSNEKRVIDLKTYIQKKKNLQQAIDEVSDKIKTLEAKTN